jgi:hypothetical protein
MFGELPRPKLLRRIGFILFALSFVTPNWRFEGWGCGAFIAVPQLVWPTVVDGSVFQDWDLAVLMGSLTLGWLSNFTVFFPLPYRFATLAIAAPWILYVAMIFWSKTGGPDFEVTRFIPFYPWALGIGTIHYSRLIQQRSITVRSNSPGHPNSADDLSNVEM